jgi:HEAT repeat protein
MRRSVNARCPPDPQTDRQLMSALNFYLNEAREGDWDAAYFGLIELGDVDGLEAAYHGETDPEIRSLIVHAVWQHRLPATIDFLAVALRDPNERVWKEALDGLVVLASTTSRKALEAELERIADDDPDYRSWIVEAIGQIDEAIERQTNF